MVNKRVLIGTGVSFIVAFLLAHFFQGKEIKDALSYAIVFSLIMYIFFSVLIKPPRKDE